MQAVQCLEFSAVERVQGGEVKEKDGAAATTVTPRKKYRRDTFRPRSQPLKLRQVLKLTTLPLPQPSDLAPTHVLIEVHYAGVQYPDALQAMGLYQVKPPLPYIPGMDVSGVVLAVGSLVQQRSSIQPGDRVLATLLHHGGTGGMAQQVVVPMEWVYQVPPTMSDDLSQVANIGRNYFAAYHSLKTIGGILPPPSLLPQRPQQQVGGRGGGLQPPSSSSPSSPPPIVLVDGASGGVGMATIQLAKAMNCKVIAGVSTVQKMDGPYKAGADVVLTYGRTKAEHQQFKDQVQQACREMLIGHDRQGGVDLVVDMVQGDLFENALVSIVRPLGTIALVGFTAGQRPIRPGLILLKEIKVVGSLWGRWAQEFPQHHRQNVQEILHLLSVSKQQQQTPLLSPVTDRTIYHLTDFVDAFELFENNQGRGNTVVSMRTGTANPAGSTGTPSTNNDTREKIMRSKL
jgi:NADPH:quinone reductase